MISKLTCLDLSALTAASLSIRIIFWELNEAHLSMPFRLEYTSVSTHWFVQSIFCTQIYVVQSSYVFAFRCFG